MCLELEQTLKIKDVGFVLFNLPFPTVCAKCNFRSTFKLNASLKLSYIRSCFSLFAYGQFKLESKEAQIREQDTQRLRKNVKTKSASIC